MMGSVSLFKKEEKPEHLLSFFLLYEDTERKKLSASWEEGSHQELNLKVT